MKHTRYSAIFVGWVVLVTHQSDVMAQEDVSFEEDFEQSVEEIIVTARKRQESIQDVPISITAITAEEVEQRDYRGLEDIAQSMKAIQEVSNSARCGSPVPRCRARHDHPSEPRSNVQYLRL